MELDFGILLTYARNDVPRKEWVHLPSDYKYDKLNLLEYLVKFIKKDYANISNGKYWDYQLKPLLEKKLKEAEAEILKLAFAGRERSASPIELEEDIEERRANIEKNSIELIVEFIESYKKFVEFENELIRLKSK